MDLHNNKNKKVDEELANDSTSSVMSVENGPDGKLWRKRLRPRKNGVEKPTASSDEEVPTATKVGKVKKGKRRAVITDQNVTQVLAKSNESTDEIMARILAENARLQAELAELRKEFSALKAEKCNCSSGKQNANTCMSSSYAEVTKDMLPMAESRDFAPKSREELVRHISNIVLETLLSQTRQSVPIADTMPTLSKEVTASSSKGRKGQRAEKAGKGPKEVPKPGQGISSLTEKSSASKTHREEWVIVEKKKNKKKGSEQVNRSARVPRLRVPRSAAVVITLQPEAVTQGLTYDKVLDEAASKIQLADLGIEEVQYKKTMTGGSMLRLPGAGPDNEGKANALASKLREALNIEGVQISRPVKYVDVRITGLPESVTTAKLLAAVARVAECPLEQLKCSGVWPSFAGTLCGVVSCPVHIAQKLGDGRKILVGWVSAQVKILRAKPLRCYRCLHCGHVAAKCKAEVDCSNLCFRCGQAGHKASECAAAPHCLVCAGMSKPAEHRVGSGTCATPANPKKKKRSKKGDKTPSQSVRSSAIAKSLDGESECREMECH